MARYYLHLRNFKGELFLDLEGAEFPSLAKAREEAILVMRDFVGAAIRHGEDPPFEAVKLVDEQGAQLAAVPIVAALPLTLLGLLKRPVVVVPADRFEDYRRFADECRGRAENTTDPSDKTSWLKLADAWLLMLPVQHPLSVDLAGWPKVSDEDSKASH